MGVRSIFSLGVVVVVLSGVPFSNGLEREDNVVSISISLFLGDLSSILL